MRLRALLASRLGRTAGIYTLANAINSAIPFLLLPVLTRYLSPYDYGIVAMFQVLLGVAVVLVGKSVKAAVARQYYDKDSVDLPVYIANCLYVVVFGAALCGISIGVFSNVISQFTAFPAHWLWAVLAVAVTQVITLLVLTLWQVQEKPLAYAKFQILLTLCNAGLSIGFVVSLGMGWQGRVSGQVLAYLAFALSGFIVLWRGGWLKWSYNHEYVKQILRYIIPLAPHALGMLAINMTDRLMITNMVGVAEMGIYVVAVQLGMVVMLLVDSFHNAWVPWFYSQLKKENIAINLKIVKGTYVYYVGIVLVVLGYTAVLPWVIGIIVGPEFFGAQAFVFWVAMGFAFHGMYRMVTSYIFYMRKTYILGIVTFMTALINVGLNYYLIALNGVVGAAQATMIAHFISFCLTWMLAAMVYRMPWSLKYNRSG